MRASDVDLGGFWATPDGSISGVGTGSFQNGRFEVVLYKDQIPLENLFNPTLISLPVLHLRNVSNGGSLLDATNSRTRTGFSGISARTIESHEFIRGIHLDSRDEPVSKTWTFASTALVPLRLSEMGETISQIPKRQFSTDQMIISVESTKTASHSRLESITRYGHVMTYETNQELSVGNFLADLAQPTMALLEICWRRKISPETMTMDFQGNPCEIFSTHLQKNEGDRNFEALTPLIYAEQMDWGKWFSFCHTHRIVVLLLADLMSGGTGFLQNQLLNVCVVLEDLSRIANLGTIQQDPNWIEARDASIGAAEKFGYRDLVSRRLPKTKGKAIRPIENYVIRLVQELDIDLPDPESVGRAITNTRNPVAHTSLQNGDLEEMFRLVDGATALSAIGLFKIVFGDEIARQVAKRVNDQLVELGHVASKMDARS